MTSCIQRATQSPARILKGVCCCLADYASGLGSDLHWPLATPHPNMEHIDSRATQRHARRERCDMGDLSRQSSRQALLSNDDCSLTSFPDPGSTVQAASQPSNGKLQSLLDQTEPSMFDESQHPEMAADPQSLSAASYDVLQNVIEHQGAVNLVRRLATLLAERDAHITALMRLAEEYNVPKDDILATASRVKRAEEMRLALRTAAHELLVPSAPPSNSRESMIAPKIAETTAAGGTVKGLTRLFAGGTFKGRQNYEKETPSSSRSTSQVRTIPRERPRSIDARSIQSADSGSWANTLFGSYGKRHDSRSGMVKEPVELLTQHDKETLPPTLHNLSEDPQTAAWNRFLTKLMESRSQGDNVEHANGIGMIGAAQFGQEGVLGQRKMKTLTQLVLGGIPMSLRHTIWMELSNTDAILDPGTYATYLDHRDEVDQTEIEAILKDVPRTLTSKYEYYAKKGDRRLREVLVAFVSKYEGLGYTQGLNTIAGYLLLVIPEDEHAFWLLCNMVDNYFPRDYFSREKAMTGPLADSVLLRAYVKELIPQLAKHLDDLEIPPDHTVPLRWFFTAFADALTEDVLMRVWDVWLCLPGHKTFLFNVALAILMQNTNGLLQCETEGEYWAYLDGKCKLSGDAEWVDELMKQAFMLRKKLEGLEERRNLEMKLLRKKGGSTEALYSPPD